jgi:sugar-specific transcriptional regulator TrmB/DNA-binding CsgD family transcriptional regulator
VLEKLGATVLEDRLYQHLAAVGSATESALARIISTPIDEVSVALAALTSRGLVTRGTGQPTRYLAAPPNIAVRGLLLQRQEALRQAEAELAETIEAYRRGPALRGVNDLIEVIPDPEAVRERVQGILRGATEEFFGLVAPPYNIFSIEESSNNPIHARVGRTVCDRRLLEQPGALEMMRATLLSTDEHRIHLHVPMKLAIVDRKIAVLSAVYAQTGPPTMMLVHRSTLLDALLGFFELIWSQATPLLIVDAEIGPLPSPLSAKEQHLLSLLMAGLTDQSIASHLGVGHRSVQRRVRQLMDFAGVQTRIQLGWHAHKHGWLGDAASGASP